MKFFLVTTEHLANGLLFADDDDFRAAMNFVAIVSRVLRINVLSFIFMSNHIHFVVECDSAERAEVFLNYFKNLFSFYYCRRHGVTKFLRKLRFDIRELKIQDESLHRGIAYTQMNCVAANIVPYPVLYPWGTGDTFFNMNNPAGQPLRELSKRRQRLILHSHTVLPGSYILGTDGYILPRSYVPVAFVEKLFGTPSRYDFFLKNSSKARMHLEKGAAPSFRDHIIKDAVTDLSRSLFHAPDFKSLGRSGQTEVVQQVKRRFSADAKQVARVTGLDYPDVAKMLDGF